MAFFDKQDWDQGKDGGNGKQNEQQPCNRQEPKVPGHCYETEAGKEQDQGRLKVRQPQRQEVMVNMGFVGRKWISVLKDAG